MLSFFCSLACATELFSLVEVFFLDLLQEYDGASTARST